MTGHLTALAAATLLLFTAPAFAQGRREHDDAGSHKATA